MSFVDNQGNQQGVWLVLEWVTCEIVDCFMGDTLKPHFSSGSYSGTSDENVCYVTQFY